MKIHFIGLGGIGVSALARHYLSQGHQVGGTDVEASEITTSLQQERIDVKIGPQKASNITKDIDLVIRSAAVPDSNPEIKEAKKKGISVKKYAQALGLVAKNYYTICVAGTHGKTTTTAMLALVFIKAGFDPTVIIGTNLKEFGGKNFRKGGQKAIKNFNKPILILEADEWQGSFLNYHPDALIITNIDKEHLDYYRDFDHIVETFQKLISQVKPDGILIVNRDDKGISKLCLSDSNTEAKQFFYSHEQSITVNKLKNVLQIPGKHNISNALGAYGLSKILGIDDKKIFEALKSYKGAWRRFETRCIILSSPRRSVTIVNDYAHHPTEIKATLETAQQLYKKRPFWVIFQPHQRQRTHYLFQDFIKCFDRADCLILSDIYEVEGRDNLKQEVTVKKLEIAIKKRWQKLKFNKPIASFKQFQKITNYVQNNIPKNAILLIMGAGDIYKINSQIDHLV